MTSMSSCPNREVRLMSPEELQTKVRQIEQQMRVVATNNSQRLEENTQRLNALERKKRSMLSIYIDREVAAVLTMAMGVGLAIFTVWSKTHSEYVIGLSGTLVGYGGSWINETMKRKRDGDG